VLAKGMARVIPQPMLCVRDVPKASRWYQRVLDAQSAHGGDEYERLEVDGILILQLHALEEEHHHGALADPSKPFGNGVAVWFEVDDLNAAAVRARQAKATVVTDVHTNPNAQHRELWLRDDDGYLVVLSGK
jgi:catechol 2,3-dioxygenase-like lactoylglutathione lyase family enzyme